MKCFIYSLVVGFYLFVSINLNGQEAKISFDINDLELIAQYQYSDSLYSDRKVKYGLIENKKTINPIYHLLSGSMFLYQKYVSPILSRKCPYNPSCSMYSKELIKEFGLVKGTICTADRLMRCTQISLSNKHSLNLLLKQNGRIEEKTDRYLLR